MIFSPEGICPLCSHAVGSDLLHEHIASETPRVRERTISVIQAYHGRWLEEQGACGPCWKSYRDAGRVLSILKEQTGSIRITRTSHPFLIESY